MWKHKLCSLAAALLAFSLSEFSSVSLGGELRISNSWTNSASVSNSFGVCYVETNSSAVWPLDSVNYVLGCPVTNHFSPPVGGAPWVCISHDGSWIAIDRQNAAMGPFWWGFTLIVGLGLSTWFMSRLLQRGID